LKVLDINGQELCAGGDAMLLCEILEISDEYVRIRVRNSTTELFVSITHDEVLGGLVAGSELTAFLEARTSEVNRGQMDDGVTAAGFE
jgi:hypothetical protein